jgi:hypothetical protein
MNITFSKIKLDKNKIPTLEYARHLPNGSTESVKLEGYDKSSDLEGCLNAFLGLVISTLDLGESWHEDGFVSGVSLKEVESDYGLNVTIQKRFEDDDCVYQGVINSPYIKPEMQTQSDALSINRLIKTAREYIESQPVQTDLLEAA